MTIWWLIVILGFIGAAAMAFIWLAIKISHVSSSGKKLNLNDSIEEASKNDLEHVFNNDFREELRNRGRLNFEKIINENAMFLQQDLRLTTSEINQYVKEQINKSLQDAFSNYEQSITDAKQMAIDSIMKTNQAINEQHDQLNKQVHEQVEEVKKLFIEHFEKNMAEIINHYVLSVLGDQIDLDDQLDYIIKELEANKPAILEDIKNGT